MAYYYKAVIFDCDGVLFDSNDLKTAAFRKTLASYPPDIVDKFIVYHKLHGGISRYIKLNTFIKDFAKESISTIKLKNLLNAYGAICRKMYSSAPLTPGCLNILELLHKDISLYVSSGSDESELKEVLIERKLDRYFKKIYGSPKSKDECVYEIIKDSGTGRRIVYVGDAESDLEAAKKAGIEFIFMKRFSDARLQMMEIIKREKKYVIGTLEKLPPLLIKNLKDCDD